jgi:hypothetical protein
MLSAENNTQYTDDLLSAEAMLHLKTYFTATEDYDAGGG